MLLVGVDVAAVAVVVETNVVNLFLPVGIKEKLQTRYLKLFWGLANGLKILQFFKKNVYFHPFLNTLTNIALMLTYKWKNHRWCTWDLNPGPQDGRPRQIH